MHCLVSCTSRGASCDVLALQITLFYTSHAVAGSGPRVSMRYQIRSTIIVLRNVLECLDVDTLACV